MSASQNIWAGFQGYRIVSYEQLWAPWRLAYLQQPEASAEADVSGLEFAPGADPKCFLCQAVAAPTDPMRHVVLRNGRTVAVLNRYPYNNGHLLVAPQRHRARLDELTAEEHLDLWRTITRMIGLLEKVLRPDGFNVGLNLGRASGAGLPGHLHWHIVPRWSGDTNFILTTGATKVIPQALDDLWQALRDALGQTS